MSTPPAGRSHFENLPPEVLLTVTDHLGNKDVAKLARTSKDIYSKSQSVIRDRKLTATYQSIIIGVSYHMNEPTTHPITFIDAFRSDPTLAPRVKCLTLYWPDNDLESYFDRYDEPLRTSMQRRWYDDSMRSLMQKYNFLVSSLDSFEFTDLADKSFMRDELMKGNYIPVFFILLSMLPNLTELRFFNLSNSTIKWMPILADIMRRDVKRSQEEMTTREVKASFPGQLKLTVDGRLCYSLHYVVPLFLIPSVTHCCVSFLNYRNSDQTPLWPQHGSKASNVEILEFVNCTISPEELITVIDEMPKLTDVKFMPRFFEGYFLTTNADLNRILTAFTTRYHHRLAREGQNLSITRDDLGMYINYTKKP